MVFLWYQEAVKYLLEAPALWHHLVLPHLLPCLLLLMALPPLVWGFIILLMDKLFIHHQKQMENPHQKRGLSLMKKTKIIRSDQRKVIFLMILPEIEKYLKMLQMTRIIILALINMVIIGMQKY